jgi:DNA-binding SARP family transcriptional activator
MFHLAISLFGGFSVERHGCPLTGFKTDKNRCLLAYLVLEAGHPHRRESLAALFWPDRPEATARNSLRQALFQLNALLPPGPDHQPFLVITTADAQFNPASDHWVDALELSHSLAACHAHHPAGLDVCDTCAQSLCRAAKLYRGELLEGLSLPRCATFTDWQAARQEAFHRQMMLALATLADYFAAHRAYDQLIDCTQTAIALEPWCEAAYRRQMWALAMTGDRETALRQGDRLREILRRELGIALSAETRRLYQQIRRDRLS